MEASSPDMPMPMSLPELYRPEDISATACVSCADAATACASCADAAPATSADAARPARPIVRASNASLFDDANDAILLLLGARSLLLRSGREARGRIAEARVRLIGCGGRGGLAGGDDRATLVM
jgi:hypothetical protein